MKNNKVRTGDTVKVISGAFFGKISKVAKVDKSSNRVYLEGIFREKFVKNNDNDSRRDNVDGESSVLNKKKVLVPIDISNVKRQNIEEKNNLVIELRLG